MTGTFALRVLDERVPMRDGAELAADVTIVDDGAPRPVLLVRTPYARASLRATHDPVAMARSGWAVVLQDVRGRCDSDGDFRPFHQEVADGYDTISWCAEQPWSDGRVVMTGLSYNGATQWLAALAGHPALKAISPSVIGPDLLDGFAYNGGAFCQGFLSTWAMSLAASGKDAADATAAMDLLPQWPQVLQEQSGRARIGDVFADYARWVPRQEEYWTAVDVRRALPDLDLPVWRMAGWYDIFCEATIDGYARMADRAGAPQRLVVGPWSHAAMQTQMTPEVDFGPAAVGAHLAAELDTFLKSAVAGTDGPSGVTVFVMGENAWRDLPSWPPPATSRTLHLSRDGVLTDSAPVAGVQSWEHDAADPVPTRGGRTLQFGLPVAGPLDQAPIEQRPDVLIWTSDELDEDLTVIGVVTARLEMSSTQPSFDLVVKLCDVQPDGRSLNVVDAVHRTAAPAGERLAVDVRVGSTAMRFGRGHRIRLLVASSDFPQYAPLPSAQQTLWLGASTLTLPLAESENDSRA